MTITATVPVLDPPKWAVLQRRLFDTLDQAIDPFLETCTRDDGSVILPDAASGFPGRAVWENSLVFYEAEADDFYETFYNWPLLYVLGGSDRLLPLAIRQWNGITRQLTELGVLRRDYELHYDWFHQGEGNLFFYFLCLADPSRPEHIDRARRFAGFFMNEDPEAPNYDPELKLIRAPHNGSGGPCWNFTDGEAISAWTAEMIPFGLPYHDLPGINNYDDLKDPARARQMGEAMRTRMGRGDVPNNLAATSLVANAYLLTGEERYRRWVIDYVDAWVKRAEQNGGLLPDNVGLSGQIGEYINGKWYGGLLGWTWMWGFYNVAMAAMIGAANAYLFTRETRYLDLVHTQVDRILALGVSRRVSDLVHDGNRSQFDRLIRLGADETFVVPYRHGDHGWFDYQPMAPIYPAAIWNLSLEPADWERIEQVRRGSGYDWRRVLSMRTKGDDGHEAPWLRFLVGDNPSYPEEILRESLDQVSLRLDRIRSDGQAGTADGAFDWQTALHHGQQLNPVSTEALVQLTLGAPSPIYNGGLLFTQVRYFDLDRRRPGLPRDVAALVTNMRADRTMLRLINLSPVNTRELVVQAGAFGEHRFEDVVYSALGSGTSNSGCPGQTVPADVSHELRVVSIQAQHVRVRLPPSMEIELDLGVSRFVNQPGYAFPWMAS